MARGPFGPCCPRDVEHRIAVFNAYLWQIQVMFDQTFTRFSDFDEDTTISDFRLELNALCMKYADRVDQFLTEHDPSDVSP